MATATEEQIRTIPLERNGMLRAAIVEVPDIRQPNAFFCGCAAAMSVGRFFCVGPKKLSEWAKALGTTEENSTSPEAIVEYLQSLGLDVKYKQRMTVKELAWAVNDGRPVICPVQDYKGQRSEKAEWDYGHWLTVIGCLPGSYVIAQDSSIENAEHVPGGDVPEEEEDHDENIAAPGRILVHEEDWLRVWHDKDAKGRKYVRYGISVGPGSKGAVKRTIWTAADATTGSVDDAAKHALDGPYQHSHTARVILGGLYDEVLGTQEVEPGIRVTLAKRREVPMERQPVSYEFDAAKWSQDDAIAWLLKHETNNYTWQPDVRDKSQTVQGPTDARDQREKAPDGFGSLDEFYAATEPAGAGAPGSKRESPPEGFGSVAEFEAAMEVVRDGEGEWITVNGTHIFIAAGQSNEADGIYATGRLG